MQVGHRLLVRAPVWQITSFSDAFLRFENAVSLHLPSVSVPYSHAWEGGGYGTETEGRWTKPGGSETQVCLFDHLAALVFRIYENQQRRTAVFHDSPGHPASVWLMELRLLGQPECVGLLQGKSLRSGCQRLAPADFHALSSELISPGTRRSTTIRCRYPPPTSTPQAASTRVCDTASLKQPVRLA